MVRERFHWLHGSLCCFALSSPLRTQNGLFHVTTLPQGTYALMFGGIDQNDNVKQLVELTASGVRQVTSVAPVPQRSALEADGAMLYAASAEAGIATFLRKYIHQWINDQKDPIYELELLGSVDYTPGLQPVPDVIKTNGAFIYCFYSSKFYTDQNGTYDYYGDHLGIVRRYPSLSWVWTGSPTGPLDGRGSFDQNANNYVGSTVAEVGGNLFYGYTGEYWQQRGQGNQFMHYRTNSSDIIGQFGLPRVNGSKDDRPGSAGNVWHFSVVKVGNYAYLYTNDEWSLGIHRWRIKL